MNRYLHIDRYRCIFTDINIRSDIYILTYTYILTIWIDIHIFTYMHLYARIWADTYRYLHIHALISCSYFVSRYSRWISRFLFKQVFKHYIHKLTDMNRSNHWYTHQQRVEHLFKFCKMFKAESPLTLPLQNHFAGLWAYGKEICPWTLKELVEVHNACVNER